MIANEQEPFSTYMDFLTTLTCTSGLKSHGHPVRAVALPDQDWQIVRVFMGDHDVTELMDEETIAELEDKARAAWRDMQTALGEEADA